MNYPAGAGFDRLGNLLIGDEFNSRVLEFKPPFVNGMNATVVIGQTNFTSASANTTQSTLNVPTFVSAGGP